MQHFYMAPTDTQTKSQLNDKSLELACCVLGVMAEFRHLEATVNKSFNFLDPEGTATYLSADL